MSLPNTSEKSVYLDREEHVHKGQVGAKRVVLYDYDATTDTLSPTNAIQTERFDYATPPVYYVGAAPLGSSESEAVWTIEKFDLTDTSNATGLKAHGAIWDDRATEIYS